MKATVLLFASASLMASLFGAGPAPAEDGEFRAGSDSCGRAAALEAAKEALARGARDEAVEHLRRAEASLDRCAPPPEGSLPEESTEEGESALAFGVETDFSTRPS